MSKTEYACDTNELRRSILKKISDLKNVSTINLEVLSGIIQSDESLINQDFSGESLKALNEVNTLLSDLRLSDYERTQLVEIRRLIFDFHDAVADE